MKINETMKSYASNAIHMHKPKPAFEEDRILNELIYHSTMSDEVASKPENKKRLESLLERLKVKVNFSIRLNLSYKI